MGIKSPDGVVFEVGKCVIKTLRFVTSQYYTGRQANLKRIQMALTKVTHRSSGIVVGSDGKSVKFSKAKAMAYIHPEKGKVRQVQVNGEWCDLFYMETSNSKKNGSQGLLGVSLKGMTLETTAVRIVAEPEKTEKAAEPEVNLADLFGDGTDNTTESESDDAPAN